MNLQSARGCPFAVQDGAAEAVTNDSVQDAGTLRQAVTQLSAWGPVVVGIAPPRKPLPGPRRSSEHGRWLKGEDDVVIVVHDEEHRGTMRHMLSQAFLAQPGDRRTTIGRCRDLAQTVQEGS